MQILIIEDDKHIAVFLKDGLEKSGYGVDWVDDGLSGQKKIELLHGKYDLAILDLMLPGQSGYEVIKNVRRQNIILPILIVSARGDERLALSLGANDYLIKPFAFKDLLWHICETISQSKKSQGKARKIKIHS